MCVCVSDYDLFIKLLRQKERKQHMQVSHYVLQRTGFWDFHRYQNLLYKLAWHLHIAYNCPHIYLISDSVIHTYHVHGVGWNFALGRFLKFLLYIFDQQAVEFWTVGPTDNREKWHRLWCVRSRLRYTRGKVVLEGNIWEWGINLRSCDCEGEKQWYQPYLHRPRGWDRSPLHSLAGNDLEGEHGDGCRLHSEKLQVQSSWHTSRDKLWREEHSRLQAPQGQSLDGFLPGDKPHPRGNMLADGHCPRHPTLILSSYSTCLSAPSACSNCFIRHGPS